MRRRRIIEVRCNRAGEWFWHEKAPNGRIVDVAQAYSKKGNAVRGARRAAQPEGLQVVIVTPSAAPA